MGQQPEFIGLHFWAGDLSRTVDFYRMIGIDVPSPDGGFASITLGNGVNLAFGSDELTRSYDERFAAPARDKSAAALQFRFGSREEVDAMYARLTDAGYRGHLAPIDAFWGARYCEVLDPDGNAVGFHSPRGG
jgi:catechol 2,3-dioxygenase-like lactoylglutathione lyase family enzyme